MNRTFSKISAVVCSGAFLAALSPLQAMAVGTRDASGEMTMLGTIGTQYVSEIAAEDPALAKNVKAVAQNAKEVNDALVFDEAGAVADGADREFARTFTQNLAQHQRGAATSSQAAPMDARVDCIMAQVGVSAATAAFWLTIFASAGVAGLAALGLAIAAIAVVQDCY